MGYIYGPVVSRRLGMSLGIDVVPLKTCPFNCIYCQLASSSKKITKRKEYVSAEQILDEFRKFPSQNAVYEWITWNNDTRQGTFVSVPERLQIPENINEQFIVELYSK